MADFTGYVNGLDVQAMPGQRVRCPAFISKQGGAEEIQVSAYEHALQTVLEHATARGPEVEVEAAYDDGDGEKVLRRVRVLDR